MFMYLAIFATGKGKTVMRRRVYLFLTASILLSFSLFMVSCNKDDDVDPGQQEEPEEIIYLTKPVCSESFTPKSGKTNVIGFYPSYRHEALPIEDIRWEKITHIVYAFATVNSNGTINTSDLTNTVELVGAAHENNVKVYFSVGGGGNGGDNFPLVASNNSTRERLVNEIREYTFANCFDGVDIDWEYWTGTATSTVIPIESNALVALLKELRTEFEPFGLEISIDLGASNRTGRHIYSEVVDYIDHMMIMCYAFSGPWSSIPGPHSSFEQSIGSGDNASSTGLAYWVNYKGFPSEKILLGVPFYGRDFDNDGAAVTYANILKKHPESLNSDQIGNLYFNGLKMMAKKTQYILDNNYGGIMIWELGQDAGPEADSVSLLNAIHTTIYP